MLTSRVRLWDPEAGRRAELARQMEDLLNEIWLCERWWVTESRIDNMVATMGDR